MTAQPCEVTLTPERILQYIDEHFNEPITPRDVADALHYSLCHLTHVARKALGLPVSDLLLRRRIAAAQCLLAESTLPVSIVAHHVGFNDMAYFSRRFARATGASPTRWRSRRRHALIAFAQEDAAQPRAALVPAVRRFGDP